MSDPIHSFGLSLAPAHATTQLVSHHSRPHRCTQHSPPPATATLAVTLPAVHHAEETSDYHPDDTVQASHPDDTVQASELWSLERSCSRQNSFCLLLWFEIPFSINDIVTVYKVLYNERYLATNRVRHWNFLGEVSSKLKELKSEKFVYSDIFIDQHVWNILIYLLVRLYWKLMSVKRLVWHCIFLTAHTIPAKIFI